MNHRLNAYKDNNIWITYCEKCSKEADELLGSDCAGQVEAVIFNKSRLDDSSPWINNANSKFDELFPIKT